MSDLDRIFQVAASDFARSQRKPSSPHPVGELLVAYRNDELSGAAREQVQDHLAACSECTEILLDLEEALPAPSPKSPRLLMSVAAALVLAVVALSIHAASVQRAYSQLARPQVNAPIAELFAEPVRGKASDRRQEVHLGRDARIFTLVLHPPDPHPERDYGIEIARKSGAVIWQGRGLRPDPYGSVTLAVPLPALGGARELDVRLFEFSSGKRSPAAVYALTLKSP